MYVCGQKEGAVLCQQLERPVRHFFARAQLQQERFALLRGLIQRMLQMMSITIQKAKELLSDGKIIRVLRLKTFEFFRG